MGGRDLNSGNPVLLDTCAAIWLMNGDPMSQESRAAISVALAQNLGVFVSPISAWEIGTLTARNRIQLAQAKWNAAEHAVAVQLLDQCRPKPGTNDYRGWEWYYFDRFK